MKQSFSLTAIILSKNEERTIKQAINSVKFCDEIIIIDDFSTDNTISIVKPLNVTVYQKQLDKDFATQRNYGLTKASHDWVLFLDADEFLSKTLSKEIVLELEQTLHTKVRINGYYFKRQDTFLGKKLNHGETSNISLLRLANKNSGKWVRPVHETWDIKGPTKQLVTPIVHRPHSCVFDFLTKINQYTTIESAYRFDQSRKTSILEMLIFPKLKFIHNYFIKKGFLDGFPGFVMAFMMSIHSLVVRIKLLELYTKQKEGATTHLD